MDYPLFSELTLVMLIAAGIAVVMRLLKQPLIMGYILTGILVGPAVFHLIGDTEAFASLSQVGITLLLFIIGLGMNPAIIRSLGKPAVLTALSILILVGSAGFATSELLGLSLFEGLIMGLALFFSSTIIILKVISDKKELSRLYAQLSIGVIVVDDVVATFGLLVVAAMGTAGGLVLSDFGWLGLKAALLLLGLGAMNSLVVPRIGKMFAESQELLFLFAIAWGLGVASLFSVAGLSYEVGALAAGVALSTLPFATQMGTRLKPLRDFFLVLFFVHIGESFSFNDVPTSILPALILSLIVIVGKPLVVMATLGWLGYTRLTSFKAGIHLSQISEFSMILTVMAYNFDLVGPQSLAIITLVALITIGVSTYLMKYDDAIYARVNAWLHVFEHQHVRERASKAKQHEAILLGFSKGAHDFIKTFRKLKLHYIAVDYNPDKVELLEDQGIRYAYGDATDIELLEELGVTRSKIVVSMMEELKANVIVLDFLKHHHSDALFVCYADNLDHAEQLYQLGAAYVILPSFIHGRGLSEHLAEHGISKDIVLGYRDDTMPKSPSEIVPKVLMGY